MFPDRWDSEANPANREDTAPSGPLPGTAAERWESARDKDYGGRTFRSVLRGGSLTPVGTAGGTSLGS